MVTAPGPNAFRRQADLNKPLARLPQSRSEGNVRSYDDYDREAAEYPGHYLPQWYHSSSYSPEQHQEQAQRHEDSRGRIRSRPPVKILEDVDEDEELTYMSPPRRSRSPHKKLFGENGWLGKTPTIEKQKRPALRVLGEKIKQRVEDMVCESVFFLVCPQF